MCLREEVRHRSKGREIFGGLENPGAFVGADGIAAPQLGNEDAACSACALMPSSPFSVCFVAYSDCFHLSDGLVRGFPVPESLIGDKKLIELGSGPMDALRSDLGL